MFLKEWQPRSVKKQQCIEMSTFLQLTEPGRTKVVQESINE